MGFGFEVMSLYLIKDKELKSKTAHARARVGYIYVVYITQGSRKKGEKMFGLANFLFGTLNFRLTYCFRCAENKNARWSGRA